MGSNTTMGDFDMDTNNDFLPQSEEDWQRFINQYPSFSHSNFTSLPAVDTVNPPPAITTTAVVASTIAPPTIAPAFTVTTLPNQTLPEFFATPANSTTAARSNHPLQDNDETLDNLKMAVTMLQNKVDQILDLLKEDMLHLRGLKDQMQYVRSFLNDLDPWVKEIDQRVVEVAAKCDKLDQSNSAA